ncbi:MAG: FAD/NAD(P)-binding protein [Candidatus Hydrogenedentota bacterium]
MNTPNTDFKQPDTYRIQSLRHETHDTFTLELVQTGGAALPNYAAGQYNVVHMNEGAVPLAICVDPAEPQVLMHTVRVVGRCTEALRQLRVHDELRISGPYGCGWPLEPAEENDIVIIAGGIGLAPMRPLVHTLIHHRERYGHITMIYGARTPEDILFRKELETWRGRFDMEVLVTVDRATGNWRGHVGVFTTLIPRAPFDPYFTVAYLAGPEIMMTYAVESLRHRGVEKDAQYLYMQRDMKKHIHELEDVQLTEDQMTGPVFRYDQVEAPLMARE